MIPYIRRATILSQMDPLTKFLSLLCIGVIVFTQPLWAGATLFVFLVFMAVVLGRLGLSDMRLGLILALFLGIFMLIGGFWTAGGTTVLFQFGPLVYTLEGLVKRGTNAVRIVDIMFSSFLFIWTTNPRDFVVALTRCKIPYRLAFTIFVGLNYIPVIAHEFTTIQEAQQLRGIKENRSPAGLLKRYTISTIAILVRGLRKAQITAFALDSKAFGAFPDRTYLNDFHWTTSGFIYLGFWFLLTVAGLYAVLVLHVWESYTYAY
jgi:energy-coupling factor transport system permease protein